MRRKNLIIFVDFLEKASIMGNCMDTKKVTSMADGKVLSAIAGKRMVVGAKQLRKALNSGAAQRVFLALNADPAITEPIEALCQINQIACVWVKTMSELGQACGIDVGAAAAAALD